MINRTLLLVVAGFLVSCQTSSSGNQPGTVAPLARAPEPDTDSRPEPGPEMQPDRDEAEPAWKPFVEEVAIDHGVADGRFTLVPFIDGYALIRRVRQKSGHRLIDLETFQTQPLPDFTHAPAVIPEFRVEPDGRYAVAVFEDHDNRTARFEIFRPESMKWESAGKLELPERATPDPDAKNQSAARYGAQASALPEGVRVWLSNGVRNVGRRDFDVSEKSWSSVPMKDLPGAACLLRCGLDEDVVRWGGDLQTNSLSCLSVRADPDSDWKRVETDSQTIMRRCRRVDQNRVLVTGGIAEFSFIPKFDLTATMVELDPPGVRDLGEVGMLGDPMELPGKDLVWMKPGEVVRFDPANEGFLREPAPEAPFQPASRVRIDERTMLAVEGKAPRRFVIYGFRKSADP